MALTAKSLINYGFEITVANASVDFRSASGGPIRQATLRFGSYSLTGILLEVKRAMETAAPGVTFTWTVDRTTASGTQNRVTVSTNSGYLDLLFATGPRASTNAAVVFGFTATDKTGSTSYTGTSTAGTNLVPDEIGYGYLPPDLYRNVFGALSVSASGDKESIVWNVQKFLQVEFKYEMQAKAIAEWSPFMTWAIQQKQFEFTPEITSPGSFYQVTFEATGADGKGLGFKMDEMLPDFPFHYKTGMIKMRVKE
jgi:hypothetical protein